MSNDRLWEQAYSDLLFWQWEGLPSEPSIKSSVGFMEQALQLEKGARVLDLGCALGYHSIELARRGYEVTGLDWSEIFLEVARQKAREDDVSVNFVRGDMTRLEFGGEFDAVIFWGNTFGAFSDEENFHTLVGIQKALKNGGKALIDTQNYLTLPKALQRGWIFRGEDENLLFLTEDTKDELQGRFGFNVIAIDLASSKRHEMRFSWRLYLLPELKQLLQAAGLNLLCIYGDDPEVVDWESYESGAPYPYAVEGFTQNAAKRILLCQK